jgi:predicted DNA-binding protein
MSRITVELSPEVYDRLAAHAKEKGTTPAEFAKELMEQSLENKAVKPKRTARELLEEAGMVRPLGDELRKLMIPDVTLDEVIEILSSTNGPSLTEILDEQRGPKV